MASQLSLPSWFPGSLTLGFHFSWITSPCYGCMCFTVLVVFPLLRSRAQFALAFRYHVPSSFPLRWHSWSWSYVGSSWTWPSPWSQPYLGLELHTGPAPHPQSTHTGWHHSDSVIWWKNNFLMLWLSPDVWLYLTFAILERWPCSPIPAFSILANSKQQRLGNYTGISQYIFNTWGVFIDPDEMDLRWSDPTGDIFALWNPHTISRLLQENRPNWAQAQEVGFWGSALSSTSPTQPYIMRIVIRLYHPITCRDRSFQQNRQGVLLRSCDHNLQVARLSIADCYWRFSWPSVVRDHMVASWLLPPLPCPNLL